MEDSVRSDSITAWSRALYENAVHRNGHFVLTCDGTMKICMGVRGRSNADVVFTVRGAQGFLFGTPLVDEKRAADVRLALEGVLQREHHDCVRWVIVDWCTVPLLEELRLLFRNLQSFCLDTAHLVMKYKSAFGNRESPGSTLLRRMMRKLNLPRDARVTRCQSLLCVVIFHYVTVFVLAMPCVCGVFSWCSQVVAVMQYRLTLGSRLLYRTPATRTPWCIAGSPRCPVTRSPRL